jgi:hypothetical protein
LVYTMPAGFRNGREPAAECGKALIAPGFIDLDALADLDTTILGFDNQPGWRKGRVWPRAYMDRGPYEMYSADELVFQKRYAFAQLLRNGITTALPIASPFYREWGETSDEFTAAADIAGELGLRVYLGAAYRSCNQVVDANETIGAYINEARGFAGLEAAIAFCQAQDGRYDGLVRTIMAPDRIETCTSELLRRTAAAARELDVPVRLHCCQSKIEYDMVVAQHGLSPPEWLDSLGFLAPHVLLPHGTWVSGSRGIWCHHRALSAGFGPWWPHVGYFRKLSPAGGANRHGYRHVAAGYGAEPPAWPDAEPGYGWRCCFPEGGGYVRRGDHRRCRCIGATRPWPADAGRSGRHRRVRFQP